MHISELDNYRLQDAVKFHNQLNPGLWDRSEHLRPEVREKLLQIAADFQEFLGIDDLEVQDITLSGSNAAFTYTPHSDIDLHLVVTKPEMYDPVFRELFNAKKYQYNDTHNIRIRGADVELYVQPDDQPHVSQGIYSVRDNQWLQVPRRVKANIDQSCVRAKAEDLENRINSAVSAGQLRQLESLWNKIKTMRKAGLADTGEFGCDNLVFKMLRTRGALEKLKKAVASAKDEQLSLAERQRPQQRKVWGFAEGHQGQPYSSEDGVAPSTCMFLNETDKDEELVTQFIKDTAKDLGIESMPKIFMHRDDDWGVENHSFGRYDPETHELHVNLAGRHIMDILRTTAHELCHCRQHEIRPMPDSAGNTGSPWENQAHATAGVIMRNWADRHPEMFDSDTLEEATGYIPKNKKEAHDPRFMMAITGDIKPGQVGREANKLALHTGRNGEPGLLMKTANLRESRIRDLNDPPGPETKPTMPRGTVRVDVSDMYDWYKLGKNIANLDKANAGQFGKGPPSTIVSFGDEDTEHKYIKNLERLGLTTTDIDPVDVNQPAGMPRQKTDPTYNVSEQASDYEIHNRPKLDRVLARCCSMVIKGQQQDPERYGQVAACVIDPDNRMIYGINLPGPNGTRRHAERVAIDKYIKSIGEIPPGSIIVTTCSPCNSSMDERAGESCKDLLNSVGIHKVYAGYEDPTQHDDSDADFRVYITDNDDLWGQCQLFAQTFLNKEEDITESLRKEFELLEDEFIGEIKMSPTNLRAEAAKTGALAGMEFEMIVPGVKNDDPEMEPDYDQDERCRSIEDAVQFFHDGDFNGRAEIQNLRERMEEDWNQWLYEKIDEDWDRDPEEHIYQYLVDNVDPATIGEIIGEDLSDADSVTKEQVAQAAAMVNDNEQQPYYDDARDWHRSETDGAWDESDWLDEQDLDTMSSISELYGVTWPHWNYNNESNADIDTVANDFSEAVGMPVNASQTYHGGRREAGHYVVEPDGSLEPDDSDDTGLEFVSPPMPIDQMLDQLQKVREWAGRYGCYTNQSTGLHINVSVPEFDNNKLDYVKLALLLGDQYVLDQFGRSSNTYAKSALSMVRDRVRDNPQTAQSLLDKMRGHMDDLATKAIHSGQTSKYTSINTKTGYIEFRSPGGDWLDENFDKIESTLLRFTVALKAAMDPKAYREEYLKKLYRLLEPTAQEQKGADTVRYFADYVAGKIPRAALRSFVKQAQLQRKISKDPTGGQQYWWNVEWSNGRRMEVVATSPAVAKDVAAEEWGLRPDDPQVRTFKATPIRPYDSSPVKASVGAPQPAGGMRPSNPDGNYVIFANNSQAGDPPAYRFMAADNDDAETVLNQWKREHPGDWEVHYDADQRLGQPPVPGSTLDRQRQRAAQSAGDFEFERSQTDIENRLGWPDQTGDANYEVVNRNTLQPVYLFIANTDQDAARKYSQIIQAMGMPGAAENYGYRARGSVMPPVANQGTQSGGNFTGNWLIQDPQGRTIHRFGGVGNVQSDANRVAIQWLRAHPGNMQAGVTVVPEMS